jgi:hypothetical protein
VLTAPQVVPIFFANDPLQAQIEQFLGELAVSTYWPATTGEYGVGPLRIAPSIVVSSPAPASITDDALQAWLAGNLDGTNGSWPAIDDNNVYVVFYPEDTIVTASTYASCSDFGGYHSEGISPPNASPPSFPYVVVDRCVSGPLVGIDDVTVTTSHELVEATTDPFTQSQPAFIGADDDHLAWNLGRTQSGELGDMCLSRGGWEVSGRLVGSFLVQRTWSDQAAGAGRDPCVPPVPGPYFAAAPDLNQNVAILDNGVRATKGLRLPIGQTATVDVRLFSDGPAGDWDVEVAEERIGGVGVDSPTPTLTFSWDKQSGSNGDILQLTMTRVADGPVGGTVFLIYSVNRAPRGDPLAPTPRAWNYWAGYVAN